MAVRYDTVIIGAGMSGLSAGVRLAYYEKNVCILERHTTIGGLNSFYRLRKRNYDVGLHAVTNYAEPGTKQGPLSKLLRQLRMKWEDFDLRPQLQSSIVFPGATLHFTNQFNYFVEQIASAFPQQIDGFRRLVTRIAEHDALDLERQSVSARQVVSEYIRDPLLVDMLFCPDVLRQRDAARYGFQPVRDYVQEHFPRRIRSAVRRDSTHPEAAGEALQIAGRASETSCGGSGDSPEQRASDLCAFG